METKMETLGRKIKVVVAKKYATSDFKTKLWGSMFN